MGEVSTSPEVAAKVIEDLTALEVDTNKGERLYKAAVIHSKQGATYRMLAKVLEMGRLDIVHYGCDLDEEGRPMTKWAIRRILEQKPERFDKEIDAIQKTIQGNGEEVAGVWVHDMTDLSDTVAQGNSLEEFNKKMAAEIRKKPV